MKARKPCSSCGKSVNSTSLTPTCRACRRTASEEIGRNLKRSGENRIDWYGVDLVSIERCRYTLNAGGRRAVVRRLASRLATASEANAGLLPGRLTAGQLGELMGISSDGVWAIARRLPPATRRRCPLCRCDMWVLEDGTVEEHGTGYQRLCPMSGKPAEVSA